MKRIVGLIAVAAALSSGPSSVAAQSLQSDAAQRVSTDDGTITVAPTFHGRYSPSVAYDSVHGRFYLFGGIQVEQPRSLDDAWVRPVSGGRWTRVTTFGGSRPSSRIAAAMIYDPVRDRLIVFGGARESGNLNDVWALTLTGNPTWVQLAPSGIPPAPRAGSGAIYDPVADRMVVFGGGGGSTFGDVFSLSLGASPEWTPIEALGTPPPARSYPAMIYDPVRHRAVIYSGYGASSTLTDTWELSLTTPTWTQIVTSGSPTVANNGVYDPLRDRMVVYGGWDGTNDVLALDFTGPPQWHVLPSTGSPPFCAGCVLLPDPNSDRMLRYGGADQQTQYSSDTWGFSLASGSWSLLEEGEPNRTSFNLPAWAVRDSRRNRMLMLLGAQLWALSFDNFTWDPITPTGPPPVINSGWSKVYDPIGDRVIFVGGGNPVVETWALEFTGGAHWAQLAPSGTQPPARSGHAAVLDTLGDRMIVFGGTGLNDTWALSLTGPLAWSAVATSGTPPPPASATGIYDESAHRMVVSVEVGSGPSIWALTLGPTPTWSSGPPTSGYTRLSFYDGARHRGISLEPGIYSAFTNALDLGTLQWSQLSPTGRHLTLPVAAVFDGRHGARIVIYSDGYCTGLGTCSRYNSTFLWSFGPAAVGVEPVLPDVASSRLVSIDPSPARGTQRIAFRLAPGDEARALEIYSVDGRRVWSAPSLSKGSGLVSWTGRSAEGAPVRAGIYFAKLTTLRGTSSRRFVRF